MSAINWQETWDERDNSIWEGLSPYSTDGDPSAGPNLHWRLKQLLCDNKVIWVAAHDSELGGDENWPTLEEAKAACQKAHDHILVSDC